MDVRDVAKTLREGRQEVMRCCLRLLELLHAIWYQKWEEEAREAYRVSRTCVEGTSSDDRMMKSMMRETYTLDYEGCIRTRLLYLYKVGQPDRYQGGN